MEQLLARLAELKAEGDAIMQQLMSAGMPPEQIMAAMEGGGQPMPPPDMGGVAHQCLWMAAEYRRDYLVSGNNNRVSTGMVYI